MPSPQNLHQDWLVHILDTIDEGIHAVDRDGVTIFYNAAAGKMDGLSPADVLGKHVLSVFPSLITETSTLVQVLKTGRAIHNQPQVYTNYLGVKVHSVNTTLPIVSEGKVVGALEVAKDLTQVRRLSEQVLELQAQVVKGRRKPQAQSTRTPPPQAVYRFSHLLTENPQMLDVKVRAQRASQTSSSILVYGETGTGKELLVQAIHNESPRQHHPFLALNCAALPASLLEGILFGTVRGSFTGAEERPGLFELADDGTLFLDEIQSMPLDLQAKLLRVLQEGELMRVGDTRVRRINVRVIAAMNVSPEQALEAGMLRKDLYYRINVVRLNLPPLRDRAEDLDLLSRHFIEKWNKKFRSSVDGLFDDVQELFQVYPWPGNVRELENAIEAALNLVQTGDVPFDALPSHLRDWHQRQLGAVSDKGAGGAGGAGNSARVSGAGVGPRSAETTTQAGTSTAGPHLDWADILLADGMNEFWQSLEAVRVERGSRGHNAGFPDWRGIQTAFERMVLQRALTSNEGNVKATAESLGIPRQTLQYRLKQLDLE